MSGRSAPYRSRCRIYADTLKAIQDGEQAKITYLLHKANLSHDRLVSHLAKMTALGLIEKGTDGETTYYSITPRGEKYLAEFRKVEDFADAFGVEI
jgi:predicted transcriptional regulator